MKKSLIFAALFFFVFCYLYLPLYSQTQVKKGAKYDTIIVKHQTRSAKKPVAKPVVKPEIVLPVPEFINQPYYYEEFTVFAFGIDWKSSD